MRQRLSITMFVAALLAPGLPRAAEVRSVSLAGTGWLERLLSRGDGGGADVEGPLVVIQTDYSDAENGNAALLFWSERSGNPAGISVFVDDAFLGTLPAPGLVFVTALDPGLRTFRIEEAGVAAPTAAVGSLTILDAQPFGDPSDLRCGRSALEDGGACELSIAWTNASRPPGYYLVLIDDERSERTPDATAQSMRLSGVERGAHELTLLGFLQAEPGNEQRLYRGSVVKTTCVVDDCSGNRFIRGLCDGQGDKPALTSAIFELGFLFLGGPSPPCLAACDADADGQVSIGDPILVLNYLFLGGPPPTGWVDLDSDGTRDPTCEAATTETCAEAHAACE